MASLLLSVSNCRSFERVVTIFLALLLNSQTSSLELVVTLVCFDDFMITIIQ